MDMKSIVFTLIMVIWASMMGWTFFGCWKGMVVVGGGYLFLIIVAVLISD